MVPTIEEATVILEAPLLKVPLVLSADGKRAFSLKGVDNAIRPDYEKIERDLHTDQVSTNLSPQIVLVPMAEHLDENLKHGTKWKYGT